MDFYGKVEMGTEDKYISYITWEGHGARDVKVSP